MVVKSPETLINLIEKGVGIKKVNVGNLTYTEGKTKITSTVSVTSSQVDEFKKLHNMGVEITLQLTPNNASEDFIDVVNKNFK